MGTMTIKGKIMRSVDVDWNEFHYTNCPLISPSHPHSGTFSHISWIFNEEVKNLQQLEISL
jgi:hypothetical protein